MATVVTGKDKTPPTYEHGTITGWSLKYYPSFATGKHKFYDLKGAGASYQINDCGDFKTGQAVEYRVDERVEDGNQIHKIYIRGENGKEHKCSMEGARANPSTSH